MIKLDEYNSQMMSRYGLEGQQWKEGDVACPRCEEEVPMLEQVAVTHTSHPPKKKVRCPKCELISYKII